MGSKIKPGRSKKDSVIIREPITAMAGGGVSRQDQIAETCEISFHVRLKESPLVKRDVPVTLQKAGPYHHILVLGSIVGKLTTRQSEMIEDCARLGVRYAGKIIKESKGMYARFTRIVQ